MEIRPSIKIVNNDEQRTFIAELKRNRPNCAKTAINHHPTIAARTYPGQPVPARCSAHHPFLGYSPNPQPAEPAGA